MKNRDASEVRSMVRQFAPSGGGGGAVAWDDVTGKPSTFTPSTHSHATSDVTGLDTALSGKQPLATVLTNTTAAFTTAQETKLGGIATGATVNSADATLLARSNHTGTQAASTISDFSEAVDDRVSALLTEGTNITLTYDDGAGTLTIDAAGGGSDPWTYVSLGSDFVTSLTANTAVTGLNFTPAASTTYVIEGLFLLRTATTTVGARPGISWPTGYTDGANWITAPNSATAAANRFAQAGSTQNAASTGLANTTTSHLGTVWALLVMGGSPSGNFQVTLATETAATDVTMRAGSFIRYRAI